MKRKTTPYKAKFAVVSMLRHESVYFWLKQKLADSMLIFSRVKFQQHILFAFFCFYPKNNISLAKNKKKNRKKRNKSCVRGKKLQKNLKIQKTLFFQKKNIWLISMVWNTWKYFGWLCALDFSERDNCTLFDLSAIPQRMYAVFVVVVPSIWCGL